MHNSKSMLLGLLQGRLNRTLLWVGFAISMLVSLSAQWEFNRHRSITSVFELSNLVGPAAKSLLAGNGLTVSTDSMGTEGYAITFSASRMPLAPVVIAALAKAFGDRLTVIGYAKTILFVLPLWLAMSIVWRAVPNNNPVRWLILFLLVLPFSISSFLADVVNLQVEEGYFFSLLGLASAMIVFHDSSRIGVTGSPAWVPQKAILFAMSVAGIYLAKSSMILVALVFCCAFFALNGTRATKLLTVTLICMTPLLWATHQYQVSGRFSIGTSLDGINLHKGNNAKFLERYPPPPGTNLDEFDNELNAGMHFNNEWQFDDYHRTAALAYMRQAPMQTLHAMYVKLSVAFFSIQKYGSASSTGLMDIAEKIGILIYRVCLSLALACAVWLLFGRAKDDRFLALFFLALVAACTLPYVLGFVYTRHFIVLIYPAVIFLCRALLRNASTLSHVELSQPSADMGKTLA